MAAKKTVGKAESVPLEGEDLANQKLLEEIRNLQAKTEDLKRPVHKRPTFWISVTTALVAVVGFFAQASWSKNEYVLASIKKEQAELDLQKLERQRAVIESNISSLDAILASRRKGNTDLERETIQLQQLRTSLTEAVEAAKTYHRFSDIPTDSTPHEHLRGLLDGWWKSADVLVIQRVNTSERNGWAMTERE